MSVEIKQNIMLGWLEITESKKAGKFLLTIDFFGAFYFLLGRTKL